MAIKLGEISFDEDLVYKQLKNDLRDDWFPDPIGFSDFVQSGLLAEIIEHNFESNHGRYVPKQAILLNVPKSNFTLRYALETSPSDRTIYQALVSFLLPIYDKTISWRVFSHRTSAVVGDETSKRTNQKYTFRNGISAWNDFLGCVRSELSGDNVLLSTDLANYFENISLALLKSSMLALIPHLEANAPTKSQVRVYIETLFDCLAFWSYSKERGLPQNRDASSFLANLYMRAVDDAMISKNYAYFRYMDDIKIVCSDINTARMALKDLILALRPLGQVVNSGKTAFVHSADIKRVDECLASGSVEMKKINAAWQTKLLKPISRSFLPLKDLTLRILREKRYDSREFRFCIARLESLARCGEFHVPDEYFEQITPLVIDGLDEAPVATDQICKYLRAVKIKDGDMEAILAHLSTPSRAIYNWKNYQLWILLTQKAFRSETALNLAREFVTTRPDDPTRAGATIFLGALGDTSDRALIAEHFKGLSTFLGQRNAVIAVQELHYKSRGGETSIDTHVKEHLRDDLKGAYRALGRRGLYVTPIEPVSITRYVDLERDYDV